MYVGSQIDWGLMFKSMPERQAFVDYVGPLREREAHVRAMAIDTASMPAGE